MILLKLLFLTALLLLVVAFSYFNTQEVSLKFLDYSFNLPLFGVVLGSFILGGTLPTLIYTFRNAYLRRRIERVEEALRNLWLGLGFKASGVFKRLASKEEVYFPLLLMAGGRIGDRVLREEYSLGIAESSLAEELIREDRVKALELLEQALGKNWKNIRARKRLRDLYTVFGELERATDLQREVLGEVHKGERKFQEKILSALESFYLLGVEDYEGEPKFKSSPEFYFFKIIALLKKEEERKASRLFEEAVNKGFGNEVLDMLMSAKRIEPAFMEIIDRQGERLSKELLCRLYIRLGMFERAQELKSEVSKTLATMVDVSSAHTSQAKEIFILLKELYKPWRCSSCGKEHNYYRFICDNCLEWFNIKLIEPKGGSR